ncbi:MAG: hypothetical protein Q8Q90_00830 [bacterium]|nr:hypothetical protein [bacterium]
MPSDKSGAGLIAELYAKGHPSGPKVDLGFLTSSIDESIYKSKITFLVLSAFWFVAIVYATTSFTNSGVSWLEMLLFDIIMTLIWIKQYFYLQKHEELLKIIEKLEMGIESSLSP